VTKTLDDMTEPELRDVMNATCRAIKAALPEGTGFIVLAAPFNKSVAQYASNVDRGDAELWMMETIKRWHTGDYVPR